MPAISLRMKLVVPLTIPEIRSIGEHAVALLDDADHRDRAGDRGLEAELDAGLAGRLEELVAALRDELLVRGHDRLAGAQRPQHVVARRLDAADQLDDQVGAGEDRLEVALAAAEDAADLGPDARGGLDRVGALGEELVEGAADGAVAEQADPRHRPAQTSRDTRSS